MQIHFPLGHVAAEPALPCRAPQAASVTFSQMPAPATSWGAEKGACTCWIRQDAPPWHLIHQPEHPFFGLACGGFALTLFRAGHPLGLVCASQFGHWPVIDSWLPKVTHAELVGGGGCVILIQGQQQVSMALSFSSLPAGRCVVTGCVSTSMATLSAMTSG